MLTDETWVKLHNQKTDQKKFLKNTLTIINFSLCKTSFVIIIYMMLKSSNTTAVFTSFWELVKKL